MLCTIWWISQLWSALYFSWSSMKWPTTCRSKIRPTKWKVCRFFQVSKQYFFPYLRCLHFCKLFDCLSVLNSCFGREFICIDRWLVGMEVSTVEICRDRDFFEKRSRLSRKLWHVKTIIETESENNTFSRIGIDRHESLHRVKHCWQRPRLFWEWVSRKSQQCRALLRPRQGLVSTWSLSLDQDS
jgi:hypothetical protein